MNIMKEQLISFDTAKLAKEKGFDERCFNSHYTPDSGKTHCIHTWNCDLSNSEYMNCDRGNRYSAPTQSLLQKWLRDECNVFVVIQPHKTYIDSVYGMGFVIHIIRPDKEDLGLLEVYDTFEEALEIGLIKSLLEL